VTKRCIPNTNPIERTTTVCGRSEGRAHQPRGADHPIVGKTLLYHTGGHK
jgi:hypothetical protein